MSKLRLDMEIIGLPGDLVEEFTCFLKQCLMVKPYFKYSIEVKERNKAAILKLSFDVDVEKLCILEDVLDLIMAYIGENLKV